MKNIIFVIAFTMLLIPISIKAQSFYMETGFNSIGRLNYTNTGALSSNTATTLTPQFSSEVGIRYPYSERSIFSMGLTRNHFRYTNVIYYPLNASATEDFEAISYFDLEFLGGNLGVDYSIIETEKWTLFFSGKFSGNILSSGTLNSRLNDVDESLFPNLNNDLMFDSNFQKIWFNLHYGFMMSYKVSELASVCSRYSMNNTINFNETDVEKYGFNSHTFSVGLILHVGK